MNKVVWCVNWPKSIFTPSFLNLLISTTHHFFKTNSSLSIPPNMQSSTVSICWATYCSQYSETVPFRTHVSLPSWCWDLSWPLCFRSSSNSWWLSDTCLYPFAPQCLSASFPPYSSPAHSAHASPPSTLYTSWHFPIQQPRNATMCHPSSHITWRLLCPPRTVFALRWTIHLESQSAEVCGRAHSPTS